MRCPPLWHMLQRCCAVFLRHRLETGMLHEEARSSGSLFPRLALDLRPQVPVQKLLSATAALESANAEAVCCLLAWKLSICWSSQLQVLIGSCKSAAQYTNNVSGSVCQSQLFCLGTTAVEKRRAACNKRVELYGGARQPMDLLPWFKRYVRTSLP